MNPIKPISRQIKGVYSFLQYTKKINAIHLTVPVDATNLVEYRNNNTRKKISYTAYMIYIVSEVLKNFPELNIAVKRSKFFPKVVQYETINAKFMLDKEINGQKKNISCVIKDSDEKKPEEIQEIIDKCKFSDYNTSIFFKETRLIEAQPQYLRRLISFLIYKNLAKRHRIQGSFMITSLKDKDLITDALFLNSSMSISLDKLKNIPIVKNNEKFYKVIMHLTMTFEEHVLNSTLASDFISEIKSKIENFK